MGFWGLGNWGFVKIFDCSEKNLVKFKITKKNNGLVGCKKWAGGLLVGC